MPNKIVEYIHGCGIFDKLLEFMPEEFRDKVSDGIFYENESDRDYAIMMAMIISFKFA